MKTIEKIVYTYPELLELAKNDKAFAKTAEKVTGKLRESAISYEWHEGIYEIWCNILEQIGFKNPDISFSGFWNQGDGASFTAKVDVPLLLSFFTRTIAPQDYIAVDKNGKEMFLPYIVYMMGGKLTEPKFKELRMYQDDIHMTVIRSSHQYAHKHTCSVEWDSCCLPNSHVELVEEFKLAAESLRQKLCDLLYSDLETEYEYRTSEEALVEESDGRYWDADGHEET